MPARGVSILIGLVLALLPANAGQWQQGLERAWALAFEPAGIGWASMEGGTTGGAAAASTHITVVSSRAELLGALGGDNRTNGRDATPAIIFVAGTIDLSEDAAGRPMGPADFADPLFGFDAYVRAFDPDTYGRDRPPEGPLEAARLRSHQNQIAHTVLAVGSNKTLIGLGSTARIVRGGLRLQGVRNVIIRNIAFADSYDAFPAWDATDGEQGHWNGSIDMIEVAGSHHVWIDRNSFSDGNRPDDTAATVFGRRVVHHDGAVDIVKGSSFVTLSANHVHHHDKAHLVGSSDQDSADRGRLKVTFAGNWFDQVTQRTPRVRFGDVHVLNNLYTGGLVGPYRFSAAIGVGLESRIHLEANSFEMGLGIGPADVLAHAGGTSLADHGSLFNGSPVDLLAAYNRQHPARPLAAAAGWRPPYPYRALPAAEVAAQVRATAGAGR